MAKSADQTPVRLFVSYAHANATYLQEFSPRLQILEQRGLIRVWDDRQIQAGAQWEELIRKELGEADIIVLFVTDNFLASRFIGSVELQTAIDRHTRGDVRLIPIIAEPSLWKDSALANIQVVPVGAEPLSDLDSSRRARAYVAIAEQIRDVAIEIAGRKRLEQLNVRQQTQEEHTNVLRMILPVVVPPAERAHLFNLVAKQTREYRGGSNLRRELRTLRNMQLIQMKKGKHVGDMENEKTFDLADFVELTTAGKFWMGRIQEIPEIDPNLKADEE